ncbi:MAG: hypothetical protein JSV53_08650 [candidate division WOR-3 bacterium]|nr:MAG: hypothetical protein JSV53_08650 [candidate division WOR-3 bacterium]
MIQPQVVLYTVLLFQIGAGNQPIGDGFVGGRSVYVHDLKTILVNSQYCPLITTRLTHTGKPALMSDTEMHGEIHTGENDITYDKIVSTTLASAGCGFLFAYVTYQMTDDLLWGYGVGATVGTATGTTLVGNTLMEPDGSFISSAMGSTLGTLVGGGIAVLAGITSAMAPDIPDDYWIVFAPALSFPVMGAVVGYYGGVPENNRVYIEVGTFDDYATRYLMSKNLKVKIGLTLTNFE